MTLTISRAAAGRGALSLPLFALLLFALAGLSAPAWSAQVPGPDRQSRTALSQAALMEERLAAERGDAAAQARLGALYFAGWGGLRQDDDEALKWLQRAAAQNHARAQAYLGILYAQGRGVERDPVTAQVWFNLAATQGDRFGQLIGPKNAAELSIAEVAQAATAARAWRQAYAASRADQLQPASGGETPAAD